MKNLIWLALIGIFFFLMIRRGGCCGGHSHGSHKNHAEKLSSHEGMVDDGKHQDCH